jgi:hypothetical protein
MLDSLDLIRQAMKEEERIWMKRDSLAPGVILTFFFPPLR